MKTDIHPQYHDVVFLDSGVTPPFKVLTRSTCTSEETIEWEDGNSYPVIRVEISAATHPFYTGKMKLIDADGIVDRFRRRYGITVANSEDGSEGDAAEGSATADAPAQGEQTNSETEATQADS